MDGAAASLRQHLEAELHNFAQQLLQVAAEDQQRAVAPVVGSDQVPAALLLLCRKILFLVARCNAVTLR